MTSRTVRAWALASVAFVCASAPGRASAQITPGSLTVNVVAGQSSAPSPAQFTVPTVLPRVDLVIAVDTTGSMGQEIDILKAEINEILAKLVTAGAVDLAASIVSFEDYPRYYSSCGYYATYGGYSMKGIDSPFRVEQAMSTDLSPSGPVVAAVNALALGNGADGPQDYSRIMYEATQSDNGIGFRAGAQRILVLFGDYTPHDCSLGTGADPGRDGIAGNSDDLTLYGDHGVLDGLKSAGVKLVFVHSGSDIELWNTLTAAAGGSAVKIGANGEVPEGTDLSTMILGEITTSTWDVGVTRSCQAGGDVLVNAGAGYLPALSWSSVAGGSTLVFNEIASLAADVPGGDERTCVVEASAKAASGATQTVGAQVVTIKSMLQVVGIRVKGGASTINLGSEGVTPVFLLGSATFDATTADVATLRLGAGTCAEAGAALFTSGATAVRNVGAEDVNDDGFTDGVLKFLTKDVAAPGPGGVATDTTVLHLAGSTTAGVPFCGEDGARMIQPPSKKVGGITMKSVLVKEKKKIKAIGKLKKEKHKPIEIIDPIKKPVLKKAFK